MLDFFPRDDFNKNVEVFLLLLNALIYLNSKLCIAYVFLRREG